MCLGCAENVDCQLTFPGKMWPSILLEIEHQCQTTEVNLPGCIWVNQQAYWVYFHKHEHGWLKVRCVLVCPSAVCMTLRLPPEGLLLASNYYSLPLWETPLNHMSFLTLWVSRACLFLPVRNSLMKRTWLTTLIGSKFFYNQEINASFSAPVNGTSCWMK